ncbi:3'-5' exonuclease [Chitinimonas sp. BJB300]|uniref:3'-5' exonuclease n=1 Tax=Chitinimonas sp. BJB300 TaxID=1559339 RepID=UPI000C0D8CED|nr:3'-5' exonuclease [Chitinimonas sp. BJB300]PHV11355.1 3'-5' exonuclease [Chitinimonas sp. BJB300]TSJ87472.1 3'-5' exonuclease domain-containing protein 2 [Chitinimonas sp. BJB300]
MNLMQRLSTALRKFFRQPVTLTSPIVLVPPPTQKGDMGPQILTKEAIQAMPDFTGLPLEAIEVVQTSTAIAAACADMRKAGLLGFDTESKPTFNKGDPAQGPHLIQLCTATRAYLFPIQGNTLPAPLRDLLVAPDIRKIGFDLRSDISLLASNHKLQCQGIDDLAGRFRKAGYRNTVGAVQAVAIMFGQHYRKSKSAKMSNWAVPNLSVSQRRYAANDAYVALRVYLALKASQSNDK